MSRRRKLQKKRNPPIYNILMVLIILLAGYCAITIGRIAGNFLYDYDSDIVINIETGPLKKIINNSLPIIDIVYNSGRISVSLTSEINALIKQIFGFDINKPETILNAQTSMLYSYYTEKRDKDKLIYDDSKPHPSPEPTPGYTQDPEQGKDENDNSQGGYIERVSSISIEDENEEREYTEDKIIARGEIKVINETNYRIDDKLIDRLYNEKLNLDLGKNGPQVLIFHTHTNESYLNDISEYDKDIPNRTDDPRYNILRVGEEIAIHLRRMGIEVLHNGTRHNTPSDDGCYVRSMDTVSTILKSYPSIKLVLDIHRDGIDVEKPKLRVVSEVEGKKAAQVMFVVGTGEIGLSHPNWEENFKMAIKMQNFLNSKYPGITRPIYLSKYRYNHHLSPGALIIEVGADGNTLEEALRSTRYIAEAISYILNNQQ
ncbi:MAG TPA: stage II sporulation protein P [Clostridiaceae bacterium]|nr:stage II sporulation protein P [Clostridiaceae bacterium]